jgi:hypothetical protein
MPWLLRRFGDSSLLVGGASANARVFALGGLSFFVFTAAVWCLLGRRLVWQAGK